MEKRYIYEVIYQPDGFDNGEEQDILRVYLSLKEAVAYLDESEEKPPEVIEVEEEDGYEYSVLILQIPIGENIGTCSIAEHTMMHLRTWEWVDAEDEDGEWDEEASHWRISSQGTWSAGKKVPA